MGHTILTAGAEREDLPLLLFYPQDAMVHSR
jgi:hypothetical protein